MVLRNWSPTIVIVFTIMNTKSFVIVIVSFSLSLSPNKLMYMPNLTQLTFYIIIYVTGYWKTDHNVTLGQLHFIGPANSHTHTLSMHHCIIGLSWLVCFSRAGFADRVKSWLRQWDPWRALDGRCGSGIHPCVGETSLKALQSCLGLWLTLLGLIATPNGPIGWCNPPPASHPPHSPPTRSPPYTCNSWYYSGCEKSCSKFNSVS